MKTPYWLIAIFAAIAAVVGASLASYQPIVSPNPIASVSPAPSSIASPSPSPSAIVASSPKPSLSPSAPSLTEQSKLVINGIHPIQIGMTVIEATKAVGLPARTDGDVASQSCFYYKFQGGVPGLAMMVVGDRIIGIEIEQGSKITTRSGAGIGSTEEQIKALYPKQIEVTPHPFVKGGNYLTFVPKSTADSKYRIIFETDSRGKVTEFRAGQIPEVGSMEGCA
ncbi:MAG: hypothetical protein KME11_14985 [Timaviella obliquedivisa GSE-PSE-MK23-08B]|jgi:hypothetical protein|nr:hypothetical protein [Timaviella obliquedivisa GSE-PSE-MK23-08B]